MKSLNSIIAALLVIAAVGCGYRLAGNQYLNKDITRVSVPVFENNSSEARAGVSFANEMVRQIMERSDTRVEEGATRKIVGTVKAITFSALSRSSAEKVVERQVTAVVDVKLTGPGGKILWSVKDFSASESYQTSSSIVNDEANKRRAVDAIAVRVAERLVSQMMSDF